MVYKHFYLSIIIRLLIFSILSVGGTYVYITDKSSTFLWVVLVAIVLSAINIINYFNRINRWMSFFISGIENEDTSLKIPEKSGNKNVDRLYLGVEKLNKLLQKTKFEISTKEYYYRSIINKSVTGLFSVNKNGRIENINPAGSKLTNLQEYFHINSLSSIDKTLPGFILNYKIGKQQSAIFENRFGQKLNFSLSEINIENNLYILVAVNDITKELDSREVDAWIKLARTLSHEIMNNITPITTLSQVISGYYIKNKQIIDTDKLDENTIFKTIKGLKVIEERSIALMNFVQNYRKFTKLPEPKLQNTDISEIINNCVIAIETYPESDKIQIIKHIPLGIQFYTDEKLISQVIINVLKNAYEAVVHENTPIIEIKLRKTTTALEIEISNNGAVIPQEIKNQIFVPFYSTKESGSGIGLSLCKQILLQMNGDIILKKSDSERTEFVISLNNI
ncbi:MAG: HAMP domain-containing histidine kinase [Bacteroidales bacterium]|nr:HAMP domain-containing histidine kinase [Bacteroidales bacterium]